MQGAVFKVLVKLPCIVYPPPLCKRGCRCNRRGDCKTTDLQTLQYDRITIPPSRLRRATSLYTREADEVSLEPAPATSSLCWGEHFGLVPSNTVQVCTTLSLLCVKGGGLCAAKLGGIVSRYFHFANTSYRWLYNPPVSTLCLADSPLCTRGPFYLNVLHQVPMEPRGGSARELLVYTLTKRTAPVPAPVRLHDAYHNIYICPVCRRTIRFSPDSPALCTSHTRRCFFHRS